MLFNILLFSVSGYALWRGGMPERLCAVIFLLATLLTLMAEPEWTFATIGVEWALFAVDFLVFAALLALALHANRFWPMWVTACNALGLLGHISVMVAPTISPLFYATVSMGSAWPAVILLGVGTYRHSRRVMAGQTDPAWTDFRRTAPAFPARA